MKIKEEFILLLINAFAWALIIVALANMLPGCATKHTAVKARWTTTEGGAARLPDSLPIIVRAAPGMSEASLRALHRALRYWNCIMGADVFTTSRTVQGPLVHATEAYWLAYTDMSTPQHKTRIRLGFWQPMISESTGRMIGGTISVNAQTLLRQADWTEAIWRHELGHVLGLDHTLAPYAMMSGVQDRTLNAPIDARLDEIALAQAMLDLLPLEYAPSMCMGRVLNYDELVCSLQIMGTFEADLDGACDNPRVVE